MSNQSMEVKVKELMELKRMKEELEAEIAAVEDEIKKVIHHVIGENHRDLFDFAAIHTKSILLILLHIY